MRRLDRRNSTELPIVDDGSNRLLLEVGSTCWANLALLFLLSTVCLLVMAPFLVAASLVGWLVVWGPMVLAVAPFWLVTIVVGDRLLEGGGVAVRELPGLWRRHAVGAWSVALAPAMGGVATVGLFDLTRRHPDAIAPRVASLIALGMSIAVLVLVNPAMAAAARYDVRTIDAWGLGARWFIAAPIQQLGLIVCCGLLIWLAIVVGPVVLLGVGPLGLLTAAIAREHNPARDESHARPSMRELDSTIHSR